MKLISLGVATVLLSVSLTSCRPHTEKPQEEDIIPSTERAIKATNIVYLDKEVMRGQDGLARFNEIIKSGNVMVDFFAHWCNPCTTMSTMIERVAGQFPSVTFLKVDTDQFRTIGSDVQGIPTLIFYKDGMRIHRLTSLKDIPNVQAFKTLLSKLYPS